MLLAEEASLLVNYGLQGPRTSLVAISELSSCESQALGPGSAVALARFLFLFFF